MTEFFLLLQRASGFGAAALGVALFLQWILANRVPARWRVWIWRVALVQTALALVPLAPIALAVLPAKTPIVAPKIIEAPAITPPIIEDAPDVAASPDAKLPPAEIAPPAIIEAPAAPLAPVTRPRFDIKSSWRELAVWIYLFGVAFQLVLLTRNIVRVRRALNACVPLDNAVLRPIAARLKIARLPRLLQSASGSPFLVGIIRPTIVVPQTLDKAHLEAVFAHELAHLRRKDLTWNALLWALQTALWFHPLSWFCRRFHALEVESACDELTLQLTPIAPKSYGALLIGAESAQSSPLVAGVNDHFFALKVRLSRLNRAPMQPRRRAAWLLSGALLLSFVAVVPIEFKARAQNKAKAVGETQSLRGTVRDFNGNPVAGATITIMEPMDNGGEPKAQTQTDANGKFALDKLKIDQYGVVVFVDAGQRGVTEKQFDLNSADDADNFAVKLPHRSFASLVLLNQNQRPVKGVEVRLFRVGGSFNSWMAMPRAVKARYRATSDEAGIVNFGPLPLGMLAQFELADQISKPTKFGLGDLRGGGQYALLAAEDAVRLDRQGVLRTVTLVPSIRLEGRVTTETGNAKGNVLILARRINAAEAVGNDEKREQLIAQTRSNAQGRYVMDGLRPGRYYVWIYPEKQLVKDFIGPSYERDLTQKTNRVDFKLSRGAIIQGVVVAKNTGKPVKGQTMWLFDSQENNQYVITDARGYFRFRALGGKQRLRVHENGSNSPPPGFSLPAKSEFNFTIKNGEKREFKIELPGKGVTKPTSGIVVGPDGQGVAGAQVFYRPLASWSVAVKESVLTNASGRFALPAKDSDKPVQLFADKDAATTPYSTIALPGESARLQLAPDAWAVVEGRVIDENKRPLEGIKVELTHWYSRTGITGEKTWTDKNGQFRFARVRPNSSVWVRSAKTGYLESNNTDFAPLQPGQTRRVELTMRRAPKTLQGVVYGENGQPASGYSVAASGGNNAVATDKNGRFAIPQVFAGQISVTVYGPKQPGLNQWQPVKAMGGDQNLVIRLAKVPRNPSYPRMDRMLKSSVKPETLVGKTAPPLRAVQWSNGRALSLNQLRDKPVFLMFGAFGGNDNEIRDVARSFGERFHFVGVQLQVKGVTSPIFDISADEAARRLSIPVAVDAVVPDKNALGWQTFQSYGQSEYAVIGRDGRVLYAGRDIDRALALATASL